MKNKTLPTYYTEAKSYAKQLVKASFDKVLYGTFKIPSQKEVEQSLNDLINYNFNKYRIKLKLKAKHIEWNKERVDNEVEKIKREYDKEYLKNIGHASVLSITEIEDLINNLHDTIKIWKIKNLG